MARIIDLDELVPEDIEFRVRGESFFARGDISVERTLRLLKLLQDIDERPPGHGAKPEELQAYEDRQSKGMLALEQEMLDLLRERHPDLEQLPVGIKGLQELVFALLIQLGVIESQEPDPPTPAKRPAPRKKSPRSSGSRR